MAQERGGQGRVNERMNEAKDGKVSEESGEGAAPATVRPETECRDAGQPTPQDPAGDPPQQKHAMNVVLKRCLIAGALMAFCWALLAATKAYGVWILSGVAVVLFALGYFRKDKKLHWHIDYLLQKTRISSIIISESHERIECTIAKALMRQFQCIVGFGSGDCKCKGHLFFLQRYQILGL